jgi:hypothetical protein
LDWLLLGGSFVEHCANDLSINLDSRLEFDANLNSECNQITQNKTSKNMRAKSKKHLT